MGFRLANFIWSYQKIKTKQMKMYFLQANQIMDQGMDWVSSLRALTIEYTPKLFGAIIIYIAGVFLIGQLTKLLMKLFIKRGFDTTLQNFLLSVTKVGLLVLLFLAIASKLGVPITGFAALLAGAGLAMGAALNGSLGNLAGGVMLMIFKPFKVGDIIEAQGNTGVVTEIGIFATTILTPENKTVFLPNGALSTGVIANYNAHGNLRVDIVMAIAADEDIDKARLIAKDAIAQHQNVLSAPAPEVNVLKVGDGMTQLAIRPYTTQDNYWDVFLGVQELVKKEWDKAGVRAPIPTRIIVNQ